MNLQDSSRRIESCRQKNKRSSGIDLASLIAFNTRYTKPDNDEVRKFVVCRQLFDIIAEIDLMRNGVRVFAISSWQWFLDYTVMIQNTQDSWKFCGGLFLICHLSTVIIYILRSSESSSRRTEKVITVVVERQYQRLVVESKIKRQVPNRMGLNSPFNNSLQVKAQIESNKRKPKIRPILATICLDTLAKSCALWREKIKHDI